MMNVVDSTGWLEYFTGAANAEFFASAIENPARLVVPTVTIYEVFRQVRGENDEGEALQAVAVMQQAEVAEMTAHLALLSAELSLEHGLPIAESVVLATARENRATLWTQAECFKGLDSVQYVPA